MARSDTKDRPTRRTKKAAARAFPSLNGRPQNRRPFTDPFPIHRGNGEIDLQPFRQAFLDSGMSISEFARRMGFVRQVPNIDQARRALGLRPDSGPRTNYPYRPRRQATYRMAVRLADALELDYTDLGI